MGGEVDEVAFRLEAAARVLERAAQRTSDFKLRRFLLEEAMRLRKLAEKDLTTVYAAISSERQRTIDDIVEEVRRWIWESTAKPREESKEPTRIEKRLEEFERAINSIIDRFEERLKKLDELLGLL